MMNLFLMCEFLSFGEADNQHLILRNNLRNIAGVLMIILMRMSQPSLIASSSGIGSTNSVRLRCFGSGKAWVV